MNFIDLFSPNNIQFELHANSKMEVIQNLVMFGVENEIFEDNMSQELIKSLNARETQSSTGIGNNVAVPHCLVTTAKKLKIVIGLSRDGIAFDSVDNLPVNIFIVIVIPREDYPKHINTLMLIAKTLHQKESRNRLLQCNSYEEIVVAFSPIVP